MRQAQLDLLARIKDKKVSDGLLYDTLDAIYEFLDEVDATKTRHIDKESRLRSLDAFEKEYFQILSVLKEHIQDMSALSDVAKLVAKRKLHYMSRSLLKDLYLSLIHI